MNTKLELYHSICQNVPLLNDNDPITHLINSINEVEEIYDKYPDESKKLFYFMKNDLHKLFYDKDYVFQFDTKDLEKVLPDNSDTIELSELFYLQLLISDQPEIVNYTFKIDYILQINNKLHNSPVNNSLQNVIVAKIIIYLIDNYFANSEDEEDKTKLRLIREENIELIENVLVKNIFLLKLKYTIHDILEKDVDEIYLEIILSLIKNKNIYNYSSIYEEVIEDLDLKSIYLNELMFKGIAQSLDENNDYLKKYQINDLKDLDEEKIDFYYILIKYILKNEAYIYNIPFLRKNFMNIIKMKDDIIINHYYNSYHRINYLFELYSGDKILDKSYNNSISKSKNDILENGIMEIDISSDFENQKLGEFEGMIKTEITCIKSAEEILKKVTIILTQDKETNEFLSYKIKDIIVNNHKIKISYFNNLLSDINDETNITYKNYQRLLCFIEDIRECISNSELKYKPDIKLELERESDDDYDDDEFNYVYKEKNEKDIYNIKCISSFVLNDSEEKKKEFKYKDYNILVKGIDDGCCGFLYLINELSNDDYQSDEEI